MNPASRRRMGTITKESLGERMLGPAWRSMAAEVLRMEENTMWRTLLGSLFPTT